MDLERVGWSMSPGGIMVHLFIYLCICGSHGALLGGVCAHGLQDQGSNFDRVCRPEFCDLDVESQKIFLVRV